MTNFSIIVPMYNKEKYIPETINSIFNQTHTNFELIIVDDGSTDRSLEVVKDIIKGDSRVKVISQVNSGVSVARNRGAKEAIYDYLTFLDGDDIWHPQFLSTINDLIKQFPKEKWFGVNTERFSDAFDFKNKSLESGNIKIVNYFEGSIKNRVSIAYSGSFVLDKTIFRKAGGYPVGVTHWEDYDLYSNISKFCNMVWSKVNLFFYRLEVENQASSNYIIREFPPFLKKVLVEKRGLKNVEDIWEREFLIARLLDWCVIALQSMDCIKNKRLLPLKYVSKCRITRMNKKVYYKIAFASFLNIFSIKLSSSLAFLSINDFLKKIFRSNK